MSSISSNSSFREYVKTHRFGVNGPFEKATDLIFDAGSVSNQSKIIVLHPPYPERRHSEIEVLKVFQSIHSKANATGYGCGKTDLLGLLENKAKETNNYNVVSFKNNRDQLTDGDYFYKDILVKELIEFQANSFDSLRELIGNARHHLSIRFSQAALLINTAALPFAALVAFVLGLLGFEAFTYFLDPQNQIILERLASWINSRQIEFIVVALFGTIIWVFYAWGSLQRDKDSATKWEELNQELKSQDKHLETVERLENNYETLLHKFAQKRRPLLLLIDDIDVIDNRSFDKILRLHEKARQSRNYSLTIVLGYNPWNPSLYCPERRMVSSALNIDHIDEKEGWFEVELSIPTLADLRSWLWGYYEDPSIPNILTILEKEFTEVRENPTLALAYFIRRDNQPPENKNGESSPERSDIFNHFTKFLSRDRRAATEIIQRIEQQENGFGAIELLKYILAFKKHEVQVQHVKAVFRNRTKLYDYGSYEKVLLSDDISLLTIEIRGGSTNVYVFRQPYMRSLLVSGWSQWRENSTKYCTEVFVTIPNLFKRKAEDPELALEAAPSRHSIDVLRREGDRLFKFAGESDASTALRYYGLTRGGALGKWFALCKRALDNNENLWELVCWDGYARLNPRQGWDRKVIGLDAQVFAPDLILTSGRLYWMIGDWKTAYLILKDKWREFRNYLLKAAPPDSTISLRVENAHLDIQAALAQILYEVGNSGHWEEAVNICKEISNYDKPIDDSLLNPSLTSALIEYYQRVGVGNALPPYQFLRSADFQNERLLEPLISAKNRLAKRDMNKLRANFVILDALWQMLWHPISPVPSSIKFVDAKPIELESKGLDLFTQTYAEMQNCLDELHTNRNISKHTRLPGGRIQDGDLLFWEGVLWFLSALYFFIISNQNFSRWELLKTPTKRKMGQRFRSYYSVANQLDSFCCNHLPDRKRPSSFSKIFHQIEELYQKWPSEHVENIDKKQKPSGPLDFMLKEEKINKLNSMQLEIRELTENLFRSGQKDILEEAQKRLRMAETIYRQLGHVQGLAAINFFQAKIAFQFRTTDNGTQHPDWLEELESYLETSQGNIGYHLEALHAHLMIANWANVHDLYLGVQSYLATENWASPERLGIPFVLHGEMNYRIGHLIGQLQASHYSQDFNLEVLDDAIASFNKVNRTAKYVLYDDIIERKISIHWWFAEIYRRQTFGIQDEKEKVSLHERVLEETERILNLSKGREIYLHQEHMARMIRGISLANINRVQQGIDEIKKAIKYFSDINNSIMELQAISSLIEIVISPNLTDWQRKQNWEPIATKHIPRLADLTSNLVIQLKSLPASERLILYKSTNLLGHLFQNFASDEVYRRHDALRWYGYSFKILVSLGLYGMAILLDDKMAPIIVSTNNPNSLESHKRRIIEAGQKIDPERERVPWDKIRRILRKYTGDVFADSTDVNTKKECLDRANKAMSSKDPEYVSAIQLLERVHHLIKKDDPEDVDIDLLEALQIAYFRNGNPESGNSIENELEEIKSIIQARDFLALAKYYESNSWDYLWALNLAIMVSIQNSYSEEARTWRSQISIVPDEDENMNDLENESIEVDLGKDRLLSMRSSEFEDRDCRELLDILETDLRNLIVNELSTITSGWWKQRVPLDVRRNAQIRKEERERPYHGRVQQNLDVWWYLDFSDYGKIICMKTNWEDVFKVFFQRQDAVSVKLDEIRIFRNDIAHHRSLPAQDREVFVTNARAILQAIYNDREKSDAEVSEQ